MTTSNLTDDDRADLARVLREAIEADRYPLSPRVKRLKALLAKIDPVPVPTVASLPPPKPPEQRSMVLGEEAAAIRNIGDDQSGGG